MVRLCFRGEPSRSGSCRLHAAALRGDQRRGCRNAGARLRPGRRPLRRIRRFPGGKQPPRDRRCTAPRRRLLSKRFLHSCSWDVLTLKTESNCLKTGANCRNRTAMGQTSEREGAVLPQRSGSGELMFVTAPRCGAVGPPSCSTSEREVQTCGGFCSCHQNKDQLHHLKDSTPLLICCRFCLTFPVYEFSLFS